MNDDKKDMPVTPLVSPADGPKPDEAPQPIDTDAPVSTDENGKRVDLPDLHGTID